VIDDNINNNIDISLMSKKIAQSNIEQTTNNLSLDQKLEFYYIKGVSSQEVGWNTVAHNCFQEHLKLAKQYNKTQEVIKSYIALGAVELSLCNYAESMKSYITALNISIDKYPIYYEWIAKGFLGISHVYNHFKKNDFALLIQRQALVYAKLNNNVDIKNDDKEKKHLIAHILLNMLPTLSHLNEPNLASSIATRIITLLKEGEKDDWLAEAYNYQGAIFLKQENYEKALASTKKAYELSDKMNAPWPVCLNLSLLGQIFTEKGDYTKAIEYLQKSLHIAKKMNFTDLEKQIKHHLMLVYDKTMMHKEVLEIIKESDNTLDSNYKDLNTHIKEQVDSHIKNMDLMLDMLEVVKENEEHQHRVSLLELENRQDALTGLYNRRALDAQLSKSILTKEHCSLIMMDIDFFKKINDTYGHLIGDNVLKKIAEILNKVCRKEDFVARYGGEEMSVLVHNKDLEIGIKTAERIRHSVESYDWNTIAPNLSVTLSLGLHLNKGNCPNFEEWIALADEQLYTAKRSGKNRVCYKGLLDEQK
jgi:diguanylate cyclase (GGDEF)-like protein